MTSGNRNSQRGGRSFIGELIFWIVILGIDAVILYLIHIPFGQWYNYKDTMPVMFVAGAFVPLAIIVLRYFPKTRTARVVGLVICIPLAFGIGMAALHAFYGENAPLDRLIYGEPFPGVTVGEPESVTLCQYKDGKQVGMTLDLDPAFYRQDGIQMDFRKVKKETPDPQDYMLYTYTGTNGKVQKVRYYDEGKYEYRYDEELGKWRYKPPGGKPASYQTAFDAYHNGTFSLMFDDHMEDLDFKPAEDYNGTGKAVFLEKHHEDDTTVLTQWYDRFIPEGFEAERVEDVRYIFTSEIATSVFTGYYWYIPSTGRITGKEYDITFRIRAFDLETGESRVLEESTPTLGDAPELIRTYLEEKTGQKIAEKEDSEDNEEKEDKP